MSAAVKILVVDDEPPIRKLLRMGLAAHGYEVLEASNGKIALELLAQKPDIVILDLGLPDIDGLDLLRRIRNTQESLPVVVLSSRGDEAGKVAALDLGADDYVTKPFGMDELLARLRAAVRRAAPAEDAPVITTDDFTIDLAAKRVRTNTDGEIKLTPTQWQLLEVLVRNRGKLVTQRQLLHDVWGPAYSTEANYLRVYVAQLRRKLEPNPSRPRYLLTETGMGYRFENENETEPAAESH
jgi:two-component system, OmpR family, KDP operon response regulator KdpE